MYVVVNAKGEVETEIDSDYMADVRAAVELAYPQHTPIFTLEDQDAEGARIENPVATPELAMANSGLPWRPNARRPGPGNHRGVGITMQEVLACYPLDRNGLDRAWQAMLEYFPNTPAEFGFKQWAHDAPGMARRLLKSNAKTAKAIEGVDGSDIPPSYAVGINLLPAYEGRTRSAEDPRIAKAKYDAKKGADEMPVRFRSLPLITPVDPERPDGAQRKNKTMCVGSSPECRATCLAFTGQNAAVAYNDYFKLFVTRALFFKPLAFARMLLEGIGKHVAYCRRGVNFEKGKPSVKCDPYLRLNVYSDIPIELFFPELFDYCASVYPDLTLYDYTKVPGRGPKPKPNYDLTFSFSGTNLDECKKALKGGQRVAVVFLRRTAKGSKKPNPKTGKVTYVPAEPLDDITFLKRRTPAGVYEGWPVIDGDLYDMRSKDPPSVIVGLRYKIPMKLDVTQIVTLHDGTEIEGKVTGKTPSDFVSIKLKSGKHVRLDPSEIKAVGDNFMLVPPSHTARFLVHAKAYKNQWVMGVTPRQTGADMESEINETEGELAVG